MATNISGYTLFAKTAFYSTLFSQKGRLAKVRYTFALGGHLKSASQRSGTTGPKRSTCPLKPQGGGYQQKRRTHRASRRQVHMCRLRVACLFSCAACRAPVCRAGSRRATKDPCEALLRETRREPNQQQPTHCRHKKTKVTTSTFTSPGQLAENTLRKDCHQGSL
jgi:hypothetical protein